MISSCLDNFRDFGTPSLPLVYILVRFMVLKSRNLPHYVRIWVALSPSQCRRHLSMARNKTTNMKRTCVRNNLTVNHISFKRNSM